MYIRFPHRPMLLATTNPRPPPCSASRHGPQWSYVRGVTAQGSSGMSSRSSARPRRRSAVRVAVVASSVVRAVHLGAVAASAAQAPIAKPFADNPVISAFIDEIGVESLRNQQELMDLRAWMTSQPGFATSGYVGSIDDL